MDIFEVALLFDVVVMKGELDSPAHGRNVEQPEQGHFKEDVAVDYT